MRTAGAALAPDDERHLRRRYDAEKIADEMGARAESVFAGLGRAIATLARVEPRAVHDIVDEFDRALDRDPSLGGSLLRLRSAAVTALEHAEA